MDPSQFDRRDLLKGVLAAGVAGSLTDSVRADAPAPTGHGRIAEENQRPGTSDWQLTYTRADAATKYRCPWIEGFCSRASVRAGESLDIFVSTNPAEEFSLDVYRLGYYGGTGGRLMKSLGSFDGQPQPDPPIGEFRVRECHWQPTTSLTIPSDWPSGVYLGKLSLAKSRYQSYVVFIVRDDRPAGIVFQCSDNTWQAYNRWPSQFSLYDNGEKEWALQAFVKVSYDRPYGKYCQILDAPLSQGSGEFLLWELPFAFWLEQHGYDVTYVSNTDVHKSADCITRGKVFLSVGHDEYWSLDQFHHAKAAVAAGVNVGFFSGNSCCFVTPLEASSTNVPARVLERAGRYGGVSEEEQPYMGPFRLDGPNEATLMGARTVSPFNGSGDWIATDAAHWLLEGTGMKNGDRVPGLVGWEFHGDPAKIPGLQIVAEGETINSGGKSAHWTATIYPGPKGNFVFNAATIFWSQGLSRPPGHIPAYSHYGRPHGPDVRVQRITENFLKRGIS